MTSPFDFLAGKLHSDGRDQGVRPALAQAFDGWVPTHAAGLADAGAAGAPSAGAAAGAAGGGRLAVRVGGYLPAAMYKRALSDSVFCLCPRGSTVWSERLVDAIVFGCIPVVVADTYWMPLSCFVDWRSFAVFVPQARCSPTHPRPNLTRTLALACDCDSQAHANRTAHILDSMPAARTHALHEGLQAVRHYFRFDARLRRGLDAFELHLLEIYLKAQFCAR